jgi:hypothetical protein
MPKMPSKVRENLVRRSARRQELSLHKSRRRDRRATDYGTWCLKDAAGSVIYLARDLDSAWRYLMKTKPK